MAAAPRIGYPWASASLMMASEKGRKQWHAIRVVACAGQCDIQLTPSRSRSPIALPLRRLSEADRDGFVSGMAFPADGVTITGTMTTFTMPGGQSGEPMHRRFCTKCGSPIFIEKDGTGRTLLMAGTLDDKSLFKPEISLFCEQAPSWVVMPANTQNLPRYYT